MKKILSIVAIVAVAASAMFTTSCGKTPAGTITVINKSTNNQDKQYGIQVSLWEKEFATSVTWTELTDKILIKENQTATFLSVKTSSRLQVRVVNASLVDFFSAEFSLQDEEERDYQFIGNSLVLVQ
ncbi:MAG: hypothetical protein FWG79_05825 [Bacteroidales bacterium]|nr:hypothetical protein [Bacteroidales bacterium]